jgi:hypothetical protein
LAGCPKAGAYALDLLPLWGNLMCAETAHHNNRDGIALPDKESRENIPIAKIRNDENSKHK